jgi:hypothetical protein
MTERSRGYVLIARGLLNHPRFKPQGSFTNSEAWVWLIMSAAHTARDVPATNGRHRVMVHLEPGQMTFSVRFLAEAWQWSNKRVQRFLSALVLDQSVTTQTTTGQTLITLCNWAKYQRPHAETTTQTATQSTTQSTTKRNELKELNELKDSDVMRMRARDQKDEVAFKKEALALAFLKAAGVNHGDQVPANLSVASERAALWIKAGYSTSMIVAKTKQIVQDYGKGKPLEYFEKGFATEMENATRPLPAAVTRLPGVARSTR